MQKPPFCMFLKYAHSVHDLSCAGLNKFHHFEIDFNCLSTTKSIINSITKSMLVLNLIAKSISIIKKSIVNIFVLDGVHKY